MAIELFVRSVPTKPNGRYSIASRSKYSRGLKLVVHVLLLGVFVVVYFPWMIKTSLSKLPSISDHELINSFNDNIFTGSIGNDGSDSDIDAQTLTMVFKDLKNEGLFQTTHEKAVFDTAGYGSNDNEAAIFSRIINDKEMDVVSVKDFERQKSVSNDIYGFAFVSNFRRSAEFIGRTLKPGGVVSFKLSSVNALPPSYKVIYLRRFGKSMFVALRKNDAAVQGIVSKKRRRRLLGFNEDARRAAALENLESVLLEPPRGKASGKWRRYSKRTRFLPDLMGEYSLESYPRRVFVHVGPKGDVAEGEWLKKNYPTRDAEFEVYEIEVAGQTAAEDLSGWLRRNVREEEYVVMKAEADVAEEIVRTKAVRLVDELFLECKPHHGGGGGGGGSGRKRAYWECLALYGRLIDEGVAVHQWWG